MRHNPQQQAASILRFLTAQPTNAHVLDVCERASVGSAGEQVYVIEATNAAKVDRPELAASIVSQCEAWADANGRETGFVARWRDSDGRSLMSHQWRCAGSESDGLQFTGEVGSIIQQLQTQNHVLLKTHLEGVRASQVMYKEALGYAGDRIRSLEKEVASLRSAKPTATELELQDLQESHETHRLEVLLTGGAKLLKAINAKDFAGAAAAVEEMRTAGPAVDGVEEPAAAAPNEASE